MNRKPIIERLDAPQGRELVISDLHGSYDMYNALLKKMHYTPGKDRLILLGDLMEKGNQNLKLLHQIMEQCENENVIAIQGNCDFVAKNILFSYRLEFLRQVLLDRPNSLIHEMIAEANLPALDENTDMEQLALQLRLRYLKELKFLNDLPHVLVTPQRIYAHASIQNEKSFADDFRYILTGTGFANTGGPFLKTVVVGHMPVTEYCSRVADFNPMFNRERNILSIDGGMQVKRSGQLNGVIFSNSYMQTVSVDALPKVKVLQTVNPVNTMPFYINWNHSKVQILRTEGNQTQVYSPWLHRKFWINTDVLNGHGATDFTNYKIPLKQNDIISLVRVSGAKALVKKNGILGWTSASILDLDGADLKAAENA
jgi:hypothetical protein